MGRTEPRTSLFRQGAASLCSSALLGSVSIDDRDRGFLLDGDDVHARATCVCPSSGTVVVKLERAARPFFSILSRPRQGKTSGSQDNVDMQRSGWSSV